MLNDFKKFIAENNILNPDEKILLAVSGGIDSMVMAHLFIEMGYETGIMHCNFALRGRESDKDEEHVRKFAESHNIPFFAAHFDTKNYAKKHSLSVQMAARELRYSWFEEVRKQNGYDLIAVAHNLNDNIETLIINLTRGTGLAGLSGMRIVNNRIIRPLLFASRKQITDYCNINSIRYREDKSNADTKYIRNKIRHQIIPVLKEINPSIETTLNETAERIIGINEIVSEYIRKLREKICEHSGEITTFNISLLRTHLHNKAIIFELFKPFGIINVQLEDLIKVINGKTGGQIFTGSHRIIKNRKEIIVSNEEIKDNTSFLINSITGFKKVPGIESAQYSEITDSFEIPTNPTTACVDADKLVFPLIVRKWMPGDHFYPLGMKQKKKLSDYFIDNKYSILDKENKLILESDGKIVWIIGDRIDNRFKITRSTKKALTVKATKKAMKITPIR
ncbi:MAG: tRNA lysidine(34) synthetase TilS [Bacteroidales bacterium]|nr:tRNA lysidine(34) synthetase TilS [Bacteroidales bacterium]MBK7627387.1 tRNA lysidine(34) synthetase TilS [Bacteroidales bacterium]